MEQQSIQAVTELSQIIWPIFCIVLILLMQVGFLCVEAGCIQKKNNMSTAIKSVVNLCVVFSVFFLVGYSLLEGSNRLNGLVGQWNFFLNGVTEIELLGFLQQAAFCCICIAIISGGIAERCKFLPFFLIAIAISLFIYPVFGHWVWGGGWLSSIGFYDYAGASVVHILAAGVALAGIRKLGPRSSRLNKQGELTEVITANAPMYALGVLILFVSWIGLVGSMSTPGKEIVTVIANMIIAAVFGGLTALLSTWAYFGLTSIKYLFRGLLGGLVAITASANVVDLQASMMIGILTGAIIPLAFSLMDRLKLDDVVGVVPVHGVAGLVGILTMPFFVDAESLVILNESLNQQHNTTSFFISQCIGATVCLLWSFIAGLVMWKLLGAITIFNLRPEEEKIGLNYTEHMSTDPLHDLNTAVELIRREQILEAKTHFDRLENSDLEGLSMALRELLNRENRDI